MRVGYPVITRRTMPREIADSGPGSGMVMTRGGVMRFGDGGN
jgi:hypothetical protein